MTTLADARSTVFSTCTRLSPRETPLTDAYGLVLASPAVAAVCVPPFASSAMDGYAVRAADTADAPVTLEVVGRVLAGETLGLDVGPGQAARIMTGAPVPAGADAVCMVEATRPADVAGREAPDRAGAVVIESSVRVEENVRGPGTDVRAGDVILDAGTFIGPTQLAALISAGCELVDAVPRPRVGVITTGDELVDPPLPLGAAQIYDSNRPMLLALVDEAGCTSIDLGRSPDDESALADRILAALRDVDALVLSGGVSVGDVDVVRMVLDRLGGEATRWMQIAIRPAKPFSFVRLAAPNGPVPVFGLPGNPVSSAVSFELLVRPVLRAMAGHRVTERPRCPARAAVPITRHRDERIHFVRVQLAPVAGDAPGEPRWEATPCPGQGSHQIRSMALADGLAVLPDGDGVDAGEVVEVLVTNPALAGAFAVTPGPSRELGPP